MDVATAPPRQFWTVGAISLRLGQPRWRVNYVIESRKIEPIDRVGGYRLFGYQAVHAIKRAIQDIEQRRRTVTK